MSDGEYLPDHQSPGEDVSTGDETSQGAEERPDVPAKNPNCGLYENTFAGKQHWSCTKCGFTSFKLEKFREQAKTCPGM